MGFGVSWQAIGASKGCSGKSAFVAWNSKGGLEAWRQPPDCFEALRGIKGRQGELRRNEVASQGGQGALLANCADATVKGRCANNGSTYYEAEKIGQKKAPHIIRAGAEKRGMGLRGGVERGGRQKLGGLAGDRKGIRGKA